MNEEGLSAVKRHRVAFQDISNRVEAGKSKSGKEESQKRAVATSSGVIVKKAATRSIPRYSHTKGYFPSNHATVREAHDIDARDSEDPGMVTTYVNDMFHYFREQESRAVVDPYLGGEHATQPSINQKMRAILIDWLADIHHKMKCDPESLHLTVQIIDRFLASAIKKATKKNLQLIGTSAFLIATKYEQIYPADIGDLVFVCDHIYTSDDILSMESIILKTLNYQISLPTAHKFLLRFLNASHTDRKLTFLTQYILETSLHSYELAIKYTPSKLAAAAVLIGRNAIGRYNWSPTLVKYTDYVEEDIIPVAREVLEEKRKLRGDLTAVKRKYSREKYFNVADSILPSEF